MNIVISCHIDTVFKEPYLEVKDGITIGANDNFASVLAVAQLINEPDMKICFTEEEEMHMDGARYLARDHDPQNTFIIVLDVTERKKGWKNIAFTVENWNGISTQNIKMILTPFRGCYKMTEHGTESEAWLYKQLGFACIEIDVPLVGGLHSLSSKARVQDILLIAGVIRAIKDYVKNKERNEISDIYKVGGPIENKEKDSENMEPIPSAATS